MAGETYTPNFNLVKIPFNKRFWHQNQNDNMSVIDGVLAKYIAITGVVGVWNNSVAYVVSNVLVDDTDGTLWRCAVAHTSASTGTFAAQREAQASYWVNATLAERFRGAWVTGAVYAIGDFVVEGNKYAVCQVAHTADATFAADLALNKWVVLVDLSAIPASAVPIPNISTALQYVRQNIAGDGYEVVPVATMRAQMGLGALALLSSVGSAQIDPGAVLTANLADGAVSRLKLNPSFMPTAVFGLSMGQAADADHDITFAQGCCLDHTRSRWMVLPAAITKRFDATFAVGDNNGGFAAGEALPVSGTMHIWLIEKADGTADVFANNHTTSALAPTLPAGFIYKRRIFSITTDASANITDFFNFHGDLVQLMVMPTDRSGTVGTVWALMQISAPKGIRVRPLLEMFVQVNAVGDDMVIEIADGNIGPNGPVRVHWLVSANETDYASVGGSIWTNTSGQIYYQQNVTAATAVVQLRGWYDPREI